MSNWVEQEQRQSWDATNGSQVIRTWQGPYDELSAFLATSLPGGFTRLDYGKVLDDWCTITATYGAPSSTSPAPWEGGDPDYGLFSRTWQIRPIMDELPIDAHPNVTALWEIDPTWPMRLRMYVAACKQVIQDWVKENAASGGTTTEPTLPPVPAAPTEQPNLLMLANQYVAELWLNDDRQTYEVPRYAIIKTELVTSDSALRASHSNVGRWHSYQAMLAAEPTLPTAVLLDTAGIETTSLIWQKRAPEVSQASNGQWQLVQEWWSAVGASTFLYGAKIG